MDAELPALEIASWDAFLSQVSQIGWGLPTQPGHVFRGQSNSDWHLEPSLTRILRGVTCPDMANALEDRLEREFFSQAHLTSKLAPILNDTAADWLDRLALMQHHGAPTRLLDWTSSPMVAAYFACVEMVDSDGAVYVASPVRINQMGTEQISEPALTDKDVRGQKGDAAVLRFFYPGKRSDRQVAQQGHFSFLTDLLATHEAGLVRCLKPGIGPSGSAAIAAKWIIPRKLKFGFLGALRQMNVAGHSLFPGTDGLGRSVREAALIERTRML